ncbi:hypothetical protein HNP24_001936 [Chryseobacterium sediminis]|uniref:Uncharacterized protein n=1 Tax=Chryseobacterium sediminis TaxID=1679494 RepID=A0ABR6PZ38_9FLAO|nr:hypothetical protein [Chryseobacterium sediminis]MBB6330986.1 hypothetical protein [Chryseobacterium sediminis]
MNDITNFIDKTALSFLVKNKNILKDLENINLVIKDICGINNFFSNQTETTELLKKINENKTNTSDIHRREFGDFQTNINLAREVVNEVYKKKKNIEFILEPTCGKGSFIIASLEKFQSIKKIVGIEIHKPYVWETKFKILSYFLTNNIESKPNIDIFHENIFNFSIDTIVNKSRHLETLIIGNPPWVTNSELGSINSENLPKKSNFKGHIGLDAITGKGNFDIGEYISLYLIKAFENHNGIFAFLIKNSVIKNIIYDQKRNQYKLNTCEKLNIDSKKEFGANVNASLFITDLNHANPGLTCTEYDFYTHNFITNFGWYKDKFVNSVEDYDEASIIDGKSIFIWRSGIKHDCAKIMELEKVDDLFINAFKQKIKLEEKLVYGLLKSSDLKVTKTNTFRKTTIITQNKIGQETDYIKEEYPLTYKYLESHINYFQKRKSSIYKGKPNFSIFGVGDYSFADYKIAISGLYKSTHFTLIEPFNSKPIMLDDTCYFIGFNKLIFAQIAHYLLNSKIVQKFLVSIVFSDEKRSINKDILMRLDFKNIFNNSNYKDAKIVIKNLTENDWNKFGELLIYPVKTKQMSLF